MKKEYYSEYYYLERSHWWFRARLQILEDQIQRNIQLPESPKILNAGVATGASSFMLEKFGEVTSLEYDKDCCEFLEEVVKMEVINGSLTELPFEDNSFDMVCAFDVVEHIEDDALALREIYRVLKKDGYVFLTVPMFQMLWSEHDVINHHFRRYTLPGIAKVTYEPGFKPVFRSYFNFWMFLPILVVRTLGNIFKRKKKEGSTGSDFEVMKSNSFLNTLLFYLFRSESTFLKRKFSLPFGVSGLIIGKK